LDAPGTILVDQKPRGYLVKVPGKLFCKKVRGHADCTLQYIHAPTPWCYPRKKKGIIMEIIVRVTSNYGAKAVYPVCETAQIFAAIAGTKTLKPETLNCIKALGYKVIVQAEEV
jgi:hypothetical protein